MSSSRRPKCGACGKARKCLKTCIIRQRAEARFRRLLLEWEDMLPSMEKILTIGELAVQRAAMRDLLERLGV